MKDVFEQYNQTMEKMWAPWQKMFGEAQWMKKTEMPFQTQWSSWIAALRSTYEVNMTWCRTLMEQGEGTFFKMYKESPFYSAAAEEKIRDAWEGLKKTMENQQQVTKEQFENMEALLKEKESSK